jgi:hypothetical protein
LRASTEAEAQWLAKNGYPSVEDLRSVDSQSVNLNALKERMDRGELAAYGLYGRALTNSGKFDEAANVLAEGIAKGSLFAVYELSRVYGAKDFGNRDVRESAAYLRAVYLMGDRKASSRFYMAYPGFGTVDFAIADSRGQELFRALLQVRQAAGTPRPTMRP